MTDPNKASSPAVQQGDQANQGQGRWVLPGGATGFVNPPRVCNACGEPLLTANLWVDDGCPCNSPRGVNVRPMPCALCRTDCCVKPAHRLASHFGVSLASDKPRAAPSSSPAVQQEGLGAAAQAEQHRGDTFWRDRYDAAIKLAYQLEAETVRLWGWLRECSENDGHADGCEKVELSFDDLGREPRCTCYVAPSRAALKAHFSSDPPRAAPTDSLTPANQGLGPPSAGSLCEVCGREGACGREREALISYWSDEAEECYRLGYKREKIRADAATKALMDYAEGNATPKEAPPSLNKESPSDPKLTNPVAAEAVQGKQEGLGRCLSDTEPHEFDSATCDEWWPFATKAPAACRCPPANAAFPDASVCPVHGSEQPPAGPPSSSLTSQSGEQPTGYQPGAGIAIDRATGEEQPE